MRFQCRGGPASAPCRCPRSRFPSSSFSSFPLPPPSLSSSPSLLPFFPFLSSPFSLLPFPSSSHGQNKDGDLIIKQRANRGGRTPKAPINENIDATEVRLIDAEGNQVGVVPIEDALKQAEEASLDLVQVTDSDPIVCKIMDYGKKIFDEKKAKAAAKKKQKQTQVKELKFRPGTEEGDYQVKLRNLVRFLENGDRGKITIRFRGREMAHQEIGMQLMQRIEADIEELAQVEMRPKMEGRQMTMVVAPRKKK